MSVSINIGVAYNGRNIRKSFADLNTLRKQADNTGDRLRAMGAQMNLVGGAMRNVGQRLSRSVTLPLAAVGVASVKTAADFESSFAKIQGLVGVSADEIGALEEAARRLGPETGKSATEAAEALFFITSAGLRGADAIETLEASLRASAIGLGETATIADLVTSAVNAYGSETLSATRATDALTAAVRYGKLEPAQLAGSMGMVLPVASAMGVSFDQVGAAFAAMSRTGTDASTAATQLRQILATILNPTVEARTELDKYGLSAEALRDQLRERGLLSVLQTLTGTLGLNDDAISKVFGNIRALSGVLDLMGSNAAATEQIFADMADTTGMTNDAFAITAETGAFQFQQALAELRDAMLSIGQDLMPIAQDFVESIRNLVDGFAELSPEQQDFIVKAGLMVAAAGPLIVVLGNLVTIIGAVTAAYAGMGVAATVAAGPVGLLAGVIAVVAYESLTQTEAEIEARSAAMRNRAAQSESAQAYIEKGEALRESARQTALEADATRYAALAAAFAAGEIDHLASVGRRNVTATVRLGAEMERAQTSASDFAAEVGGPGGATENVVALSGEMRRLFQELNETNVGVSDARDLIAQFSREVLAAGNITEATARGAEMLARAIRQDIDAALQDGNRRLDEATQKFDAFRDAIAGGVTQGNTLADAVSSQTSALEELTRAEEAYEAAQASGDAQRIAEAGKALADARKQQGTFLDFLQTGALTAEGFAAQIDALREAGASMAVVQQIAELGATTGGRVIAELLSGGAEAIRQANDLVAAVEAASQRAGVAAAQQFFGAGVNAARAFIRAIEDTIPELQAVLDSIAQAIQNALGVAPDVDISGGPRPFIPPGPGGGGGDGTQGDGKTLKLAQPLRPGEAVPLGEVRFFADGGLVTGPTLGVIGEAGPEMVIPLDRLGSMGGQTVINVTVTSADPQAVVEALRRYTRNNGPLGQVVSV